MNKKKGNGTKEIRQKAAQAGLTVRIIKIQPDPERDRQLVDYMKSADEARKAGEKSNRLWKTRLVA